MAQNSRRKSENDKGLIPKILILVFAVIFVFEGQMIYNMFTFRSGKSGSEESEQTAAVSEKSSESAENAAGSDSEVRFSSSKDTLSTDNPLSGSTIAGIQSTNNSHQENDNAVAVPTVSNPDSPAIVQEQQDPVDDSYFSDAVFIGDSRMEGFRNTSGITTGRFFTSVGMSLSSMTNSAIVSTSEGNVTVAAALSGGSYGKIYIMLGANDLGSYDWEEFREGFASVLNRFQEIQPNSIIYVCSCIYVEESKVTTGNYINNINVDTMNSVLLEVCEENDYYYLDLNEVLSDGHGSLISGASADGVHLNEKYYQMMLEYMKTHYIQEDSKVMSDIEDEDATEQETETGSEEDTEQALETEQNEESPSDSL